MQVSTGLDSCDSYDNLLLGADAAESKSKINLTKINRKLKLLLDSSAVLPFFSVSSLSPFS